MVVEKLCVDDVVSVAMRLKKKWRAL